MEAVEKEIKQLPEVSFNVVDCSTLREWIVKDWPNPSFWSPDERLNSAKSKKTCGDLFFDGIEVETNCSGVIVEIGGLPYLFDKERYSEEKMSWPNSKCASVELKKFVLGETLYFDESGNQDVFYDRETKVGKWTYDKNHNSDEIVNVATNIAIGARKGKLHEVWFRYNEREIQK